MLLRIILHITGVLFEVGSRPVWLIPVCEILGGWFYKETVLPDSRQAGTDIAKYLYRPVARNGIH